MGGKPKKWRGKHGEFKKKGTGRKTENFSYYETAIQAIEATEG
jgi:hypothetical protein